MEHILTRLSRRYPQLLLPISDETKTGEAYKNAVLRGEELTGTPDFTLSERDSFEVSETPAGSVEVLTLSERADFEHCIRALARRCENAVIPPSMGASTISGLINWEKIRAHKEEYLLSGGDDWNREFASFTGDSRNYRDTVIVLSRGPYSALSPEEAGFEAEEWLSVSHEIRKYHELAHFVSRRLFPENKDAVRDEVLADMNGIIAALGHYDGILAGKFLGIRDGKYFPGGRLRNYAAPEELPEAAERAGHMIRVLSEDHDAPSAPFEYLLALEERRAFIV